MSKDKPVTRDKKKGSNGNVLVPGNGGENSTNNSANGSENGNVGIKSEPMERERDRSDEEVKEEPGAASDEPQPGGDLDLGEENVSSADVKPPDLALSLTDAKSEEAQLLDNPVSCKSLKTEDGANAEPDFGNDGCDGGALLSQQPLPSNVINKQPATMEAQYMQQQSQIFVFSTALANKSAESVLQGQYASIIAYHCAQPRTKKFLEKHPLKMTQFNRQNPAQWLNNLAQMKQKGGVPGVKACQGVGRGALKGGLAMEAALAGNRMPLWNQGGGGGGPLKPEPPGMLPHSPPSGLLPAGIMSSLSDFADDGLGLSPHHSLAGVKVPDENLTPQQRAHREEQLATLRKMQQMLFPENRSEGGAPPDLEGMADAADWQKLLFDERKKKNGNAAGNGRGQGPPPPYHRTTRSASVPIAAPSPDPGSPSNNTSDLSLPSPRTCSALGSPAESKARHPGPGPSPTSVDSPGPPRSVNVSDPGTPVSGPTHPSPKKEKQNGNGMAASAAAEYSPASNVSANAGQQSPVDSLFCRSLQSLAQKQQPGGGAGGVGGAGPGAKEPSLMPVPSPQQIQYLNTFEGHELTIQKQPNTSLKETGMLSPSLSQKSETGGGVVGGGGGGELNSKVSGRSTPLTPVSMEQLGVGRFSPPAPVDKGQPPRSMPDQRLSQTRGTEYIPTPEQGLVETVTVMEKSIRKAHGHIEGMDHDERFCPSPGSMQDAIATSRGPFNMMSSSPTMANSFMHQQHQHQHQSKPGGHFMELPSPNKGCAGPDGSKDPSAGPYPCVGPDNVPLNPNGMTRISVGNSSKVSHFDPITSLAQMSQQLTNNVGGSPVGQPGGAMGPGPAVHPAMMSMQFNPQNVHMMPMGGDMGVCPGQDMGPGIRTGNPQMVAHPHAFSPGGGRMPCPSVSPKPNVMHGYGGPPGPRAVARPPGPAAYNGANVQVKPSAPNTIQYLPTRPQGAAGPRGPPSLEFLQRFSNPLTNLDAKVPTHNLQYFPNNYQQPGPGDMMGNVGCGGGQPGPNVMRGALRGASGGMMRVGVPNAGGFGGNDQMFGGPGGPPCQMFVPDSKGSPMGMGMGGMGVAPEASQPLPPSMGQANSFKNSSFVGPTTADPNYAQQFHNFQQQLYATNTRNQQMPPAAAAGHQFFIPK